MTPKNTFFDSIFNFCKEKGITPVFSVEIYDEWTDLLFQAQVNHDWKIDEFTMSNCYEQNISLHGMIKRGSGVATLTVEVPISRLVISKQGENPILVEGIF